MVSSSINQENTLVTHRGTIVLLNKVVQPCYINAFISIASVRDSNNFIACHFFVKPTPYNHGPQGNNNRWYSCPICHRPAPKATRNPLLSLAQKENKSGNLSRDFLTDRYRPSIKGNSLKPNLYQVYRLYIPSLVLSTRLFFSLQLQIFNKTTSYSPNYLLHLYILQVRVTIRGPVD